MQFNIYSSFVNTILQAIAHSVKDIQDHGTLVSVSTDVGESTNNETRDAKFRTNHHNVCQKAPSSPCLNMRCQVDRELARYAGDEATLRYLLCGPKTDLDGNT